MKLLTTKQAADMVGLSTRSIQTMLADGRLTRYRLQGGNTVRIDQAELLGLFTAERNNEQETE